MTPARADVPLDADPPVPDSGQTPSRARHLPIGAPSSLVLASVLLAALWPVTFASREEIFEIPKGTWARKVAGDKREILPSTIYLLTGIRNVLVLKNSDDVPQTFGPTLLMPGQTLRIPFTRPSENYFACTAHSSGQLLIVVEAAPVWPWSRLGYRLRRTLRSFSRS